MSDEPSSSLVDLLARLRLATPGQVQSVAPHVRRLARNLPAFESVWIDALAQARVLTPFQASQINAGCGDRLLVGSFVLRSVLPSHGFADCYAARDIESSCDVRLLVVQRSYRPASTMLGELQRVVEQSTQLHSRQLASIESVGIDGDRPWAATQVVPGQAAADWMIENGRFPPEIVLHIAREMAAALAELEHFRLLHGDVSARGLILDPRGHVVLPHAGLRGVVRPAEGYAYTDLPPEAYDYLAPERIADGTPPTTASDLYACGCLWWHLLTGRPPFAGGSSLAKLRAVQEAGAVDVRRLAPATPEPLWKAVAQCMQRAPQERPQSMRAVAELLGSPTRAGSAALARLLANREPMRLGMAAGRRARRVSARSRAPMIVAVVLTFTVVAGFAALSQKTPTVGRATRPPVAALPSPRPARSQVVALDPNPSRPTAVAPLLLPAGRLLELESLELEAGQTVRGAKNQRPLVQVPPAGLIVTQESVTFENIDFVWNESEPAAGAMIALAAERAQFRGCSFQAIGRRSSPPAAIVWSSPATGDGASQAKRSGELMLVDCVLRDVSAGVDCRFHSAASIELGNTLHVRSGPLVLLDRCPKLAEPLFVSLTHCTLRESAAVLECRYQRLEDEPGKITIAASDSAFVPQGDSPLVSLVGERPPGHFLKSLGWTGQGSLVSAEAPLAVWTTPSGKSTILADESLEVSGLVRSAVRFAGGAAALPTASRLVHWQAPLRSTEPPGIGDGHFMPPALLPTQPR